MILTIVVVCILFRIDLHLYALKDVDKLIEEGVQDETRDLGAGREVDRPIGEEMNEEGLEAPFDGYLLVEGNFSHRQLIKISSLLYL